MRQSRGRETRPNPFADIDANPTLVTWLTLLPGRHRRAAAPPAHPLAPDAAAIDRFLAHCHRRRRCPARTSVFMPGDPAGTLYYVVRGSVSILTEEEDGRELVLATSAPASSSARWACSSKTDRREVQLRTRSECEMLAEIGYERLYQLLAGPLAGDATSLVYAIGAQLSRRLLDTSRKAGRLAFLDVSDRIERTLHDLAGEPEAMSHPQGTQAQGLAPGAGPPRRLLARDGRARAEEAAGRRQAACPRQDRGAVRHPLTRRMGERDPLEGLDLRNASPADADDVAALLTDLGYPLRTRRRARPHRDHHRQRPPGAGAGPPRRRGGAG